ncbi:MAG: type I methionyl aminopeptidase [Oscillospiraceae bacterium]|nr:type I methionyl aminopeptidase [Oscillospiraceae bacterium]MDD4367761.1 type I methionyl aminopeptidase [Oscillospiraceae bacterium]
MIEIKTMQEIEEMKPASRVVAEVLKDMKTFIRPGISTLDIDRRCEEIIRSFGAEPSSKNYGDPPFPGAVCVSVDDEVVHGIGRADHIIRDGMIVSVDVVAKLNGWHGDAARTYPVGTVRPEVLELIKVTEQCFWAGFEQARPGNRLGDISAAVQAVAVKHGYGIVRELTGHGIGREMHEDPEVLNYGHAGHGPRLQSGMVLAIEPMINLGTAAVEVLEDEWTIVTRDGKPSCHYENTVALTEAGPIALTIPETYAGC